MMDDMIVKYQSHTKFNTPRFSLTGFQSWCRVVDIIDGDTLIVIMEYNNNIYQFHVRLVNINAKEWKSQDELALKAKERILNLVTKASPAITLDRKSHKKVAIEKLNTNESVYLVWLECHGLDAFGRILGDVFCDNISVSQILLKEGLVDPYSI